MSKFTPGPWVIKFESQAMVYGADGFNVVAIDVKDDRYGRPNEERANAALIAAAPEMYEALKSATSTIEVLMEGCRARGITDGPVMVSGYAERLAKIIAKAEGNL